MPVGRNKPAAISVILPLSLMRRTLPVPGVGIGAPVVFSRTLQIAIVVKNETQNSIEPSSEGGNLPAGRDFQNLRCARDDRERTEISDIEMPAVVSDGRGNDVSLTREMSATRSITPLAEIGSSSP